MTSLSGLSTFFCSKIMPSLGIGDLSVAEFPLDFGVWGDAGLGEKAAKVSALGLRLCCDGRVAGSGLSIDLVAHFGISFSPKLDDGKEQMI